uniref:Uncharacterized protein n=1 Tax=Amphimedon queenslandica TaxID=400682 RepID=A0A1X7SNU0_AMPQE
ERRANIFKHFLITVIVKMIEMCWIKEEYKILKIQVLLVTRMQHFQLISRHS